MSFELLPSDKRYDERRKMFNTTANLFLDESEKYIVDLRCIFESAKKSAAEIEAHSKLASLSKEIEDFMPLIQRAEKDAKTRHTAKSDICSHASHLTREIVDDLNDSLRRTIALTGLLSRWRELRHEVVSAIGAAERAIFGSEVAGRA